MMGWAVLGGLVIAPLIATLGQEKWDFDYIYETYLRHIGAGCVAAAGIISMARTMPMIVRSFASGLSTMRGGRVVDVSLKSRTENDLPPSVVFGGSLFLLAALTAFLPHGHEVVASRSGHSPERGWSLLFGFLFVTVSSRLTGEIGSSSNPISGMTVATLLMTCLIFLSLGWTTDKDAVLALSIGAVVCIAASNGGTTSQDLKTGFLIGATPRWQQWAILVGALTSAVVIGGTLLLFNQVGIVYSERNLPDGINLKSKRTRRHERDRDGFDVQSTATTCGEPKEATMFMPGRRRSAAFRSSSRSKGRGQARQIPGRLQGRSLLSSSIPRSQATLRSRDERSR